MTTTKLDTVKIERIIKAIEDADVAIIGDSPDVRSVGTYDPNGEQDHTVVWASWIGYEGERGDASFTEAGLSAANITGNKIECEDSEGGPSVIELFDLVPKAI